MNIPLHRTADSALLKSYRVYVATMMTAVTILVTYTAVTMYLASSRPLTLTFRMENANRMAMICRSALYP